MSILDGKLVSRAIKDKIADRINEQYVSNDVTVPTLACVMVGDNPASKIYVGNKEKACKYVGFNSVIKYLPDNATQREVAETLIALNEDKNVSGILLQLPLPKHLDETALINLISPSKDVDSLTVTNLGKVFAGQYAVAPCTAIGIIDMLKYYHVGMHGKHAVVVGRSLLVGKTVATLLEQHDATVTICHSKTTNLAEVTKNADILVVAVGKPNFITKDMVKEGAVVIDVGINRTDKGLVGDVDFEHVKDKASFITPVPGGVGPMTIAELMKNTLVLHEMSHNMHFTQENSKKHNVRTLTKNIK